MNPSTRQLEAFAAVARTLSFREAAERLFLSQSAVSQCLRELEGTVGVKLLDRTTRSVALTEAGRLFLPAAERVLGDLEAAVAELGDVASGRRGRAVVAALPSVASRVLPPVVAGFQRRFPGLRVVIRDTLAHEIVDLVRSGAADLGVSVEPRGEPALGFTPLVQDQLVAVLAAGHPLAEHASVRWSELAGHPFIAMAPGTSVRALTDAAFARMGAPAAPAYEVAHLATAAGLAAAGLGVCALPSLATPAPDHPGLVQRPLTDPAVERAVGVLVRAGRTPPPAAEHFRAFLAEAVSAGSG